MSGRNAVRILLCVMLAGMVGATTSCKSAPQGPPAPLVIADGMKITMDMTVTLPDKTVESTVGKKPVTFTQGKHAIWPILEIALVGMRVGEKKIIALAADQ
ncbi:MAG: FKBP-type peptidyl-prolyl cis-trans isomerase, partial [Nitrospirales bacterium]|nr:FKBP-type peptidyl-prolyl cis-trans isomerase [Nitrospirales bacterium]